MGCRHLLAGSCTAYSRTAAVGVWLFVIPTSQLPPEDHTDHEMDPEQPELGPVQTADRYLSISDVDGQVDVTERARSNLSDQLVLPTDYELGFGAAAARHDQIHSGTITNRLGF